MSATTPAGFHHGFPLGDLRRRLRARALEAWGMMAAAPWWQRLLAAATAGVLAGWAFGGAAAAVVAGGLLAGPSLAGDWSAERVRRRLDSQLAIAIDLIARSVTVGGSLRQALDTAATRVTGPLSVELHRAGASMDLGERPARALAGAADRSGSSLLRFVAVTLAVHEEIGGRLDTALRGLASVIRDRRTTLAEIRAATAQSRLSGVLVALLPVVTSLATPVDLRSALSGPAGILLEALGWGLALTGLLVILRMTRAPRDLGRAERREVGGTLDSVFCRIGAAVPSVLRRPHRNARLLAAAGLSTDPASLDGADGARCVGALAGGLATLVLTSGPGRGFALAAAAGGWFAVELRWTRKARARRTAIEADLPQVCDLIALCLSGGTSLREAVMLTSRHLSGVFEGRLESVVRQLEWGAGLVEAMGILSGGTACEELDEVVSTLVEVHRMGGESAATLSALASDQRLRRRLRAQAEARTLSVRILVPLVFCILPAFGLLTVVPMLAHAVGGLGV